VINDSVDFSELSGKVSDKHGKTLLPLSTNTPQGRQAIYDMLHTNVRHTLTHKHRRALGQRTGINKG
jgi:hypothetical protein